MTEQTPETAPEKKSLWRKYLDISLIWKLAVGLVLGVAAGLLFGESITVIEPLGEIFINLLMMLVMPLVLFTLMAGVASVSPKTIGRVGGKTLLFYMVTTAFAMTVGISLALAVSPGAGLDLPDDAEAEEEEAPALAEVLTDLVPDNIFGALSEGDVLPVMFFAVVAGVALSFMLDSNDQRLADMGADLRRFIDSAVELIFLIIKGVLEYSPIGVFALIAVVVGETGTDALLPLLTLTGVVYGGAVVQILIFAGILLLFRAPVARFFREAKEPMLTAFVTRSSGGTLPVSTAAAERMGVRRGVYSFTLPLGATINMDGTAIYVGAATVFVANVTGEELSFAQIATVALVGVLASIGTAGVPSAGLVMLTMAVTAAGLPMAPIALVAGIDAILDMARTSVNVTGDLTATRVIARTEKGMLDDDAQDPKPASAKAGTGSAPGSGAEGDTGPSAEPLPEADNSTDSTDSGSSEKPGRGYPS